MAPRPTSLLALGFLPAPSISAEPGPVSPQGRSVTIVCRAPGDFEIFRLEDCSPGRGCTTVEEKKSTWSLKMEARFLLTSMHAAHYACVYQKSSAWSSRSKTLKVLVTGVDVTQAPNSPASALPSARSPDLSPVSTSPRTTWTPGDSSHMEARPCQAPGVSASAANPAPSPLATSELKAVHLCILIGVSVGFLLLLLLLLLFCLHRQRQNKHGLPRHKDQEQRPQERASLAGDGPGRTAGWATADRALQQGREQGTSVSLSMGYGHCGTKNQTPLQGPQEVTYAQLDHRALTLRGAQDVSPRSTECSTYAILARQGPSPPGSCT
ncbi:PREDICTED: leukocyte-associated immunoglobulin-like receptor 1 isoform X2 [Chinchilla lanigera]|uniref:leukocyte-associated immunoglobulin-like receptor 1 isoform X2 n=1 Tax=Chinchilla lanigera TaxID=34839 RepID=UPI0006964A44|nr:PREDICTED: leukocyte-associated immunoglobulin-like receptor 1 isoform X2 [Chinchilla lanigera]